MSTGRQMALVAFLQAQNCTNFPASWRHPAAASDFLSPEYYQRLGRTLEEGAFHLAFFDDRLAIPDVYADDFSVTMREGIRAVKLDPMLCAMSTRQCNRTARREGDLFDHLLRTVSCCADVCHAGPAYQKAAQPGMS